MKNADYSFIKLQEVVDDMSQALGGLAKSLNKTKRMIEVLSKTKQAAEFKEDIEEMSKALDAKEKEYNALLKHRNMLNDLLAKYKNAVGIEKIVMEETLMTVFIAFNVILEDSLNEA